jgi:hypothetical protein
MGKDYKGVLKRKKRTERRFQRRIRRDMRAFANTSRPNRKEGKPAQTYGYDFKCGNVIDRTRSVSKKNKDKQRKRDRQNKSHST